MKHVHIILEDDESRAVDRVKGKMSWKEFILSIRR